MSLQFEDEDEQTSQTSQKPFKIPKELAKKLDAIANEDEEKEHVVKKRTTKFPKEGKNYAFDDANKPKRDAIYQWVIEKGFAGFMVYCRRKWNVEITTFEAKEILKECLK